jgi:hypothetical protein
MGRRFPVFSKVWLCFAASPFLFHSLRWSVALADQIWINASLHVARSVPDRELPENGQRTFASLGQTRLRDLN